jgi:hypothetical protein
MAAGLASVPFETAAYGMTASPASDLPPRVVVVLRDQWTRALLRAALREDGYDAIGSPGVRETFRVPRDDPARGPVRLLIVDQDALGSVPALVPALIDRLGGPPTILIRRVTKAFPTGEWSRVLQRPVSVDDVVVAARGLVPLPSERRHPVDD